MEGNPPEAHSSRERPSARFGILSLVSAGIGLFLCFAATAVYLSAQSSGALALLASLMMGLAAITLLIGVTLGTIGLVRRERPFVPAALGLLVAGMLWLWWTGLLFPLHAEGDKARQANCRQNEKTILLAIAMYADSYGGRCPMDSTNPTLVGSLQLLSNVLGSAKVLYCPDDTRPGAHPASDFNTLNSSNISYSYVPNLKWQDAPDSPVILDRIYSTTNGSAWPADGNHHGWGGNVGFNDGHAQWCNVLPAALKDKNGRQVVLSP